MKTLIQTENAQPHDNSPALNCQLTEKSTFCFKSKSISLSPYLKMLDLHSSPYNGSVHYTPQLHTAYLNPEIQLVSWLPSFANLTLAANYHQLGTRQEINERADYLLDCFSCTAIRDRLPHFISPLERKYLLIARTLMLEPQLLFLDTPFIGLNRQETEKLTEKLVTLAKQCQLTLVTNETGSNFIQLAQAHIIYCDTQKFHYFSHWNDFQRYLKVT